MRSCEECNASIADFGSPVCRQCFRERFMRNSTVCEKCRKPRLTKTFLEYYVKGKRHSACVSCVKTLQETCKTFSLNRPQAKGPWHSIMGTLQGTAEKKFHPTIYFDRGMTGAGTIFAFKVVSPVKKNKFTKDGTTTVSESVQVFTNLLNGETPVHKGLFVVYDEGIVNDIKENFANGDATGAHCVLTIHIENGAVKVRTWWAFNEEKESFTAPQLLRMAFDSIPDEVQENVAALLASAGLGLVVDALAKAPDYCLVSPNREITGKIAATMAAKGLELVRTGFADSDIPF